MNKTIILLMLFLFIPSCGWQLKGNNYLSPDIENVDITVQSLDPQIKIKFKSILDRYMISNDPSNEKKFRVTLSEFEENKRIASINSTGRASEYRLNMTVTYVVTNLQEKKIIDTNKISTEEVYEFSQENILASWEEEQKVKSDLIENLLLQLFKKLNFLLN